MVQGILSDFINDANIGKPKGNGKPKAKFIFHISLIEFCQHLTWSGAEGKPTDADILVATAGKVASFCHRTRGILQPPEGSLVILDELHYMTSEYTQLLAHLPVELSASRFIGMTAIPRISEEFCNCRTSYASAFFTGRTHCCPCISSRRRVAATYIPLESAKAPGLGAGVAHLSSPCVMQRDDHIAPELHTYKVSKRCSWVPRLLIIDLLTRAMSF